MVWFFAVVKMQIISKINPTLLGSKPPILKLVIQFTPLNNHFGIKMVILTPKMIKNVFRKYLHLHGSEKPYQYLYRQLFWPWYLHIFKGHPIRTSIKTDFSIYFKNISNIGWFLIMFILFVLEYSSNSNLWISKCTYLSNILHPTSRHIVNLFRV